MLSELSLAGEIVSYVVLQQPSINITTGAVAKYSIIGEVYSNVSIFPTLKNLLLYKCFKVNKYHTGKSLLDDVSYAPLHPGKIKPPVNKKGVLELIDHIDEVTVDNGGQDVGKVTLANLPGLAPISSAVLFKKAYALMSPHDQANFFDDLDSSREEDFLGAKAKTVMNMSKRGLHIIVKEDVPFSKRAKKEETKTPSLTRKTRAERNANPPEGAKPSLKPVKTKAQKNKEYKERKKARKAAKKLEEAKE
jgi:hypothetical protein